MIYDPQASEFVNVPGVWEQLGLTQPLATLAALTDRVAALESALDQAQASIATLERAAMNRLLYCPADGLMYEVRLQNAGGSVTLDWRPYPMQLISMSGGVSLGDVPAECGLGTFDRLPAADGETYDLSVVEMSGVKTLHWEPVT